MASFVFMVESNCADPTREAELNDWYNSVHVQDVLKTGIVKKATRYELTTPPGEGRGKFLAVYEIDTDDIVATMEEYKNKMMVLSAGRISDLLKSVSRSTYKKLVSFEKK
jgi:hypothetical protein